MKKVSKKIGFIGCGNMGRAILDGIIANKVVSKRNIIVYDCDKKNLSQLKRECGVITVTTNEDVVERADIIILAIKPQSIQELSSLFKKHDKKIVVSILAGTSVSKIKKILKAKQVIRTMPNMGAMLGIGVTAIAKNSAVSKSVFNQILTLFESCGDVVVVSERSMNAVTAISGSGPAYYFYLSELLMTAAVKNGLSNEIAEKLVLRTACAASAMMRVSDQDPSVLRKMVTSKKGTTEAALSAFKKHKLDKAVFSGVKAAITRGEQLSK